MSQNELVKILIGDMQISITGVNSVLIVPMIVICWKNARRFRLIAVQSSLRHGEICGLAKFKVSLRHILPFSPRLGSFVIAKRCY
jgi:hypothetical protein